MKNSPSGDDYFAKMADFERKAKAARWAAQSRKPGAKPEAGSDAPAPKETP